MTDGQYAILKHVLEEEKVPDDLDTLIINASCGTCINIKGHVDRIIVHDDNPDVITQARGRYRDDLDILYHLDKEHVDIVSLEGFLDRRLFKEERDKLCASLNFRNRKGALYKWHTVNEFLENSGYTVDKGRQDNSWYYVIHAPIADHVS